MHAKLKKAVAAKSVSTEGWELEGNVHTLYSTQGSGKTRSTGSGRNSSSLGPCVSLSCLYGCKTNTSIASSWKALFDSGTFPMQGQEGSVKLKKEFLCQKEINKQVRQWWSCFPTQSVWAQRWLKDTGHQPALQMLWGVSYSAFRKKNNQPACCNHEKEPKETHCTECPRVAVSRGLGHMRSPSLPHSCLYQPVYHLIHNLFRIHFAPTFKRNNSCHYSFMFPRQFIIFPFIGFAHQLDKCVNIPLARTKLEKGNQILSSSKSKMYFSFKWGFWFNWTSAKV